MAARGQEAGARPSPAEGRRESACARQKMSRPSRGEARRPSRVGGAKGDTGLAGDLSGVPGQAGVVGKHWPSRIVAGPAGRKSIGPAGLLLYSGPGRDMPACTPVCRPDKLIFRPGPLYIGLGGYNLAWAIIFWPGQLISGPRRYNPAQACCLLAF
jgi:hypothetical protein